MINCSTENILSSGYVAYRKNFYNSIRTRGESLFQLVTSCVWNTAFPCDPAATNGIKWDLQTQV